MAKKQSSGIVAAGAFGDHEPTANEIMGLWTYKLSDYQELGLRNYIYDVRPMVDMRHQVYIPKEYKDITGETRTPFMRDAMVRVASSMVRDTPMFHVPPIDESQDAQEAADIVSRWLMNAWDFMQKENRGENLFYKSSRSLTRDSESVIKVVDRTKAWANFPPRGKEESASEYNKRIDTSKKAAGIIMPFAATEVDRARMVFENGEFGDRWAMEFGTYPAPEIIADYGEATRPLTEEDYILPKFKLGGQPVMMGWNPSVVSTGPNSTLKLEYMDEKWWAVIINGQMAPGWPKPNPYAPFIPWIRATAEPVLYSLRYYQPRLDSLLTGKSAWAYLSMYPIISYEPVNSNQTPTVLDMPVGNSAQAPVGNTFKPGKISTPPPGYKLMFQTPPSTGAAVDQLIQIYRDLIDIAGIPSIFRGVGGARQAGYAINQLMAAANVQYKNMGTSLSYQFERASELILYMIATAVPEALDPIWAGTVGIKRHGKVQVNIAPLDLVGPVNCTFKPTIPSDEQATQMIGLQALSSHSISHETFLRDYMNFEDPQAEIDKILVETEMATNPELHELIVQEAFRKAGIPRPTPPGAPPGAPGALPGPPGTPPGNPGTNGQAAAGLPAIMQMVRPNQPAPPAGPGPQIPGGRPAGAYPGRPTGPERTA